MSSSCSYGSHSIYIVKFSKLSSHKNLYNLHVAAGTLEFIVGSFLNCNLINGDFVFCFLGDGNFVKLLKCSSSIQIFSQFKKYSKYEHRNMLSTLSFM